MGSAVANLTMYTKESQDDLNELEFKKQQTRDQIYELKNTIMRQQKQKQKLEEDLEKTKRNLKKLQQKQDRKVQVDPVSEYKNRLRKEYDGLKETLDQRSQNIGDLIQDLAGSQIIDQQET